MRQVLILSLALLVGCADGTPANDDDGGDETPWVAQCSAIPVANTVCSGHPGNEGAWLRGQTASSPELAGEDLTGDLVVVLTHSNLGQAGVGGVVHISTTVADVDLAAGPVDWSMDMCLGGEMFSEENCSYNLIAILDRNGNNGPGNFVPDEGELATRVGDVWVSCSAESPCFTLELDCTDGADCVAFTDPGNCSCENGCNSEIVTCQ
ncbi:MAG: hypothetical protein KDA24_15460 [Deltaproteobacteria bacterium]|nr:hypothetical protein [Deltaproteobacteria bacterium]